MKTLFILTIPFLFVSCNQMKELYKEIRSYGYIEYQTPLASAGPGTLVGGSPKSLSLISDSETCFPSEIDGVSTDLYRVDHTAIPQKTRRVTVSNNTQVSLANFMSNGTPTIEGSSMPELGIGINFNLVKTMSLEMEGVTVEYLDSVRLTEFYHNHMSETCKTYLSSVGFIIQAMKVERMELRLYNKNGGAINFGLMNVASVVNITEGVNWEVENNTVLVIESPKFIGYQLGHLRPEDNGYVLYRATKTRGDKFIFKSLNVFEGIGSSLKSRNYVEEPHPAEFNRVTRRKKLSRNSRFR